MATDPAALRVTLQIDGGFAYLPGLARSIALSAAQLGDEHAAQLQRLCESACAVAQKRKASRDGAIPDGRRYRLTVELGDSRREVTAADPVDAPAIAKLIAFVEKHGRR